MHLKIEFQSNNKNRNLLYLSDFHTKVTSFILGKPIDVYKQCTLPSSYVVSKNRSRCKEHDIDTNFTRIPRDRKYYYDQVKNKVKYEI